MAPMIRAITLDLDDTLWPFPPIGERIERGLHAWFEQHSPPTAAMFPIPAMRALREQIADTHPHHAHDLGALRRLGIAHALRESGGDPGLATAAYDVFYAERNRVDFYPDARAALEALAALLPICSVTNGNADIDRIGIGHLFTARVTAREFGTAKPDTAIFHHACVRLGTTPQDTLHIGDDIKADVRGAQLAGLRTCWINRRDETWPAHDPRPDVEVTTLDACVDWLLHRNEAVR